MPVLLMLPGSPSFDMACLPTSLRRLVLLLRLSRQPFFLPLVTLPMPCWLDIPSSSKNISAMLLLSLIFLWRFSLDPIPSGSLVAHPVGNAVPTHIPQLDMHFLREILALSPLIPGSTIQRPYDLFLTRPCEHSGMAASISMTQSGQSMHI